MGRVIEDILAKLKEEAEVKRTSHFDARAYHEKIRNITSELGIQNL